MNSQVVHLCPFVQGGLLPVGRVFLLHESDATEITQQSSDEVLVGQPSSRTRWAVFQSHTLFAGRIEREHSRLPDRIEAVEPCRVLFNVGFYRKKVFANELGSVLIFI